MEAGRAQQLTKCPTASNWQGLDSNPDVSGSQLLLFVLIINRTRNGESVQEKFQERAHV